jgi:Zn-dependent membrane protease YugP
MTPELLYLIGTVLIIPAILFGLFAQIRVQQAFEKYGRIPSQKGVTAAQLATRLLRENDCSNVTVEHAHGHLSDHYDPRKKKVCLSSEVYDSTSLAALGIAAHEVGHAIQDRSNYAPLKIRQVVIKTTSIVNKLLLPLIILGLVASFFTVGATIMGVASETFWFALILAFCIMYGISFVINLITLPTEFDASRRAKKMLGSILFDEEEQQGVSKVLSAAAMTYVAAFVVSLAYFLRFLGLVLMIVGNRK